MEETKLPLEVVERLFYGLKSILKISAIQKG